MTATRYIRLEADGLDPLELDSDEGWIIQSLDLGSADTREVVAPAVDADGTDDTTQFTGARPVSLDIILVPTNGLLTREQMRKRLLAFTHPRIRPVMYAQLDTGEDEVRIELRRSQFRATHDNNPVTPMIVQWVAPAGVIESSVLHAVNANATSSGSEGGRTYDKTYDKVYAGGTVIGEIEVDNAGTADVYPLLRIYGPCTDPAIANITQGRSLEFSGLTVNAGEFLEIDVRARTIYYLGNANDSRYDKLDFPASSWWTLSPGENTIRFTPATSSPPSYCEVNWRDAWL